MTATPSVHHIPEIPLVLSEMMSECNHAVVLWLMLVAGLSTFDRASASRATTSGHVTNVPATPLAVLQMIDSTGAVTKDATTDGNVRFRIKALTSTDFHSPLIDRCWYGPLTLSEDKEKTKLTLVANKGCGTGWPFKAERVGFLDNGPLELLTSLFSLAPLYHTNFSYTEFTCEIFVCARDQHCSLTCPFKQDRDFRVAPDARHVNVSAAVYVEKVKATPKPTPAPAEVLIIGPDSSRKQDLTKPADRKSFLEQSQSYFLLATLGAAGLTMMCSLVVGYKFIANANRKRANKKASVAQHDQNDVIVHVISPPPSYTKDGLWTTPESRQPVPRFPEEERCMLVHSSKTPRHYDDSGDVMIRSPPGGELFPEARVHGRSPASLNVDGYQRIRGRGTDEILGVALKEYFENRGLNL